MKRTAFGASLLLSGSLIFSAVLVAAGSAVSQVHSWATHLGRFWFTVGYYNLTPVLAVAAVMMFAGILIMALDAFEKQNPDSNTKSTAKSITIS